MTDSIASKLRTYWFTSINNSPLIIFRILFGSVMLMEFSTGLTSGWVTEVFVEAPYRFTFIGFEFLHVLRGEMMYAYYVIACIISLMVAAGLLYRPASVLLAVMWTALYFSQKSHYNNHYYLMVLLCWLMVFMPANKRTSLDVKLGLTKPSNTCYRWQVHMFIAQIAIVYTYAAIAKMYPDWLNGIPVRIWFTKKARASPIAFLLTKEWFIYFIAYAGMLFDLLVVPALLWKKTRNKAVAAMLLFHIFNGTIFGIGVFPYLAMSLNVFFYPGSTFDKIIGKTQNPFPYKELSLSRQNLILFLSCSYVIWQFTTPLRHHFYKGDVTWTEEGHRMSWRMMLRTKRGHAIFKVSDKNSEKKWIENPREILLPYQASDIGNKPDFIWQYAQMLKDKYKNKGYTVAVYAECYSSLNGRKEQLIVNPEIDLTSVEWNAFKHHNWIITEYK